MLTVERISAQPTFAKLRPETLASLADRAQELSYPPGAEVVGKNDFAYHFFVIEEGTAEVVGSEGVLAALGPDDFFGEIGLLVTGTRTATVVATSPLRLIALFDRDLRQLFQAFPELETQLRAATSERFPRR